MKQPRPYWIGAGWKMNKTLSESIRYADGLLSSSAIHHPLLKTFVIPPFTSVRQVKQRLAQSPTLVGAQNMHAEKEGAYTGEISAAMLIDCNLDIVELGHSERRRYFAETDEQVGLKTEAAIRAGLMPLICIGETRVQRDRGDTDAVLDQQVRAALGQLRTEQLEAPILFAYEPVWAIGSGGVPASADYTNERHACIIAITKELTGRALPCLYGGSVDRDNCRDYTRCEHVDGLFIGRAAWELTEYQYILDSCLEVLCNEAS